MLVMLIVLTGEPFVEKVVTTIHDEEGVQLSAQPTLQFCSY